MSVAVDKEGFLKNLSDWDEQVAHELALQEEIELTEAHWQVIEVVRGYYDKYKVTPVNRVLVKIVGDALGADKGKSIYLMKLFTGKPAKIAAKIAGLPRPTNCD